jgi:hypothetical protein
VVARAPPPREGLALRTERWYGVEGHNSTPTHQAMTAPVPLTMTSPGRPVVYDPGDTSGA